MNTPLSLLASPDPQALAAQVAAVLPLPDWTATTAWLRRLGIDDTPTIAEGPDAAPFAHRRSYTAPGGEAQLDIEVTAAFAATLCARRFGGRPAAPGRGSAVEATLAGDLIEQIAADLSRVGRSWQASSSPRGDGPAFTRALFWATLDDGPHAVLRLSGALLCAGREIVESDDWSGRLAEVVQHVRLPVRGVLARPQLSAGEVARLSIGAVIPIRAPDRVTLLCGHHRLGTGALTEVDGHAAITLDPRLEGFA